MHENNNFGLIIPGLIRNRKKNTKGAPHYISRGTNLSAIFCRWQIIHFNQARQRADNVKFYCIFI